MLGISLYNMSYDILYEFSTDVGSILLQNLSSNSPDNECSFFGIKKSILKGKFSILYIVVSMSFFVFNPNSIINPGLKKSFSPSVDVLPIPYL